MSAKPTEVTLARGLGFQIDQVEDDEDGSLFWRWMATGGLVNLIEAADEDDAETEQLGFDTEESAARHALGVLAACAQICSEGF